VEVDEKIVAAVLVVVVLVVVVEVEVNPEETVMEGEGGSSLMLMSESKDSSLDEASSFMIEGEQGKVEFTKVGG